MLSEKEAQEISEKSGREIKRILDELESNAPGMTEGLGALMGAGGGGAALSTLGTAGLSAAGITSGLAAAGSLVGGVMVAGVGVLAAPVAILGIAGYSIFKHKKVKKQTAALQHAITELYAVMEKLRKNAARFKENIAGIKATIELLN